MKKTKFSPIKERIFQFLDSQELKKVDFYKITGIHPSNFKSLAAKSELSGDKIAKILSIYPEINPEWLLTGKGEMLRKYEESGLPVAVAVKDSPHVKAIPLVDERAVAGFGNSDFAIKEQDVKEYYTIPKFKYRKVDFMIEVYGNSMYPKYNSGDIVAATIINQSRFIQWNKPHVIATKYQGILVKRILKGPDENTLLLKSDNKDYPPFELPVDEVDGIALIVGVIRLE